jgi:hypothetical protein
MLLSAIGEVVNDILLKFSELFYYFIANLPMQAAA